MANQYDNEDDFEPEDDKPKGLRAQLETLLAEKKTLEQELNSIRSSARERIVKEVLAANGVNEGIAKFIPADAVDEEAIVAWLEENANLFGTTASTATATPNKAVSSANAESASRLAALSQRGSVPTTAQDFEARLREANTKEELAKVWDEIKRSKS